MRHEPAKAPEVRRMLLVFLDATAAKQALEQVRARVFQGFLGAQALGRFLLHAPCSALGRRRRKAGAGTCALGLLSEGSGAAPTVAPAGTPAINAREEPTPTLHVPGCRLHSRSCTMMSSRHPYR